MVSNKLRDKFTVELIRKLIEHLHKNYVGQNVHKRERQRPARLWNLMNLTTQKEYTTIRNQDRGACPSM